MANKRKNGNETPIWVRIICGALGVLMILGVVFMVLPVSSRSIAFAAENEPPIEELPTDDLISVGLHCESEAVISFSVNSDDGFELAYRKTNGKLDQLLTYPAGELALAIDDNLYRYGSGLTTENLGIAAMGGYHIEISYFTFSELGLDDRDNPVYIEPGTSTVVSDGYTRTSVYDYIELLASIGDVKALDQPIFPYFADGKTYIRLGSYFTKNEAEAALFVLEKSLTMKASVVSPSNKTLTVLDSVTWTPVCELSTDNSMLQLSPKKDIPFEDNAGHSYRGSLLFDRASRSYGARLQVINRLPLEEYVAALLAYEVSAQENAELLRAMAVVLRTEAIRHSDAHEASGYDVCIDSHCHRYSGGTAEASSIRKAVLETAGMILTYNGKAIYTPYTTESGSTTISSEDAFGKKLEYLPALVTPWEDTELTNRWSVELTPYEFYILLTKAGFDEIKGNIQTVTIKKKAENSDYVTEIEMTDHFGNSVTLSGSEQIRSFFGGLLPSNNFVVGKAGEEVTVTNRVLSGVELEYTESTERLLLEGTYDSFVFSGRGVGAGVGLSISGARELGKMGYTYDRILAIYYPQTKIDD